jgi:hypothetical protein
MTCRSSRRCAEGAHRDVFLFFINADKERNPAAAMALIDLLRK